MLLALAVTFAGACPAAERSILIVGDSLSAGYGLALADSWPALLDARLIREGYPYRVVNASISGETTAGGARRMQQLLTTRQPAVVVIALGANDGLRGLDVETMRRNLDAMIGAAEHAGAVIVLVDVRIPPNYGPRYTSAFEAVFAAFASRPGLVAAPFMLARFATDASAFQSDGLHPTAAVQPQILDTLWPSITRAIDASVAGSRS